MRRDQAEKLAARITEEAGIPASVLHVEGGAREPFGYAVTADGRRIGSPAQWAALQRAAENPTPGSSLALRRQDLGLSQSELAGRLGVHPNVLARWERGEVEIAHPEMLALALTEIEREVENCNGSAH